MTDISRVERFPGLHKEPGQLVLAERIRRGERRWVTAIPQMIFKARTLSFGGPDGVFKLHDIVVGRNSQLTNAPLSGLSMESFGSGKGPDLGIETCQVGQSFELLVENVSGRDAGFDCLVLGDSVG